MNQQNNTKLNNFNLIGTNNKVRNYQSSQNSVGYSGSNVFGVVLLLVVILVIISASYWLYNYYSTQVFIKPQEVEAMPDVKNATSKFTIGSGTIPNSNYSNEYSISCWINILDYNYNYGKEKVILRRGEAGSGNPEIVLAAKTNDLIVRLKLQGAENTVSEFMDIPIPIPIQIPEIGKNITTTRENFNITSKPSPVNFENSSNGSNGNNKLGENNVDYPTIQYVSNDKNFNDTYFSMISGNDVGSNGGNVTENFDDITDATQCIVDILVDICDITTYLQNSTTSDTMINIINMFFDTILEYIDNIHLSLKNGTTNIDTINTQFQTKMMSLTDNNNILKSKMDKLKADTDKLNTYKSVVIEYNILKNAINTKMNSINCPLTFDGTTELDGSLSFLENFTKLLKMTIQQFMSNLGKSLTKSSSCNSDNSMNDDPTIGTCVVKMIPLQKWVHIVVSVYNQVVDIYIDGLLSSSCVLKKFPALNTTDVQVTPDGGFSGMISRVKFTNSAMTIQQAKTIYYEGPIVSSTLFSMIPNWVYWTIGIIIIVSIVYSFIV
jgi:hypothetical protein